MTTLTKTAPLAAALLAALAGSGVCHAATVSFSQYDWVSDSGGYTAFNSEWGYAKMSFTQADAALFQHTDHGYRGYLNVYTEAPGGGQNWAVKNVPIGFQTPADLEAREGDGFEFNLGIQRGSQALTSLGYRVSIDPVPATSAARGIGPFPTYAGVSKQEVLLGGVGSDDPLDPFDAGGTGQAEPATATNYDANTSGDFFNPPPATRAIIGWGTSSSSLVPDRNVPEVDERRNHCAPGSVTRGIHALRQLNPGMNLTDDVATTQGALAANMGTTERNGTSSINRMVNGKNQYQQDRGLNIQTRVTRNPGDVADTLGRNGVAEMIVNWGTNDRGERMGAHAVYVAEVEREYDANNNLTGYRVRAIDDPRQGDNTAANRSRWYSFRPDGTMIGGPGNGGRLMGFMTETYLPAPGVGSALAFAGLFAARRRRPA